MRNFTFKRQLLFVMFMLLGCLSIQAADDDLITKQITIKLDKAGTLPRKIVSYGAYKITNLRIIGEINGMDWQLIREMAGRDYNGDATKGNLSVLDLSESKIVDGDRYCYYYFFGYGDDDDDNTNYGYTSNDKIGDFAFCGCSGLTSLTIPDGVTEIGKRAFMNCSGLTSLPLPSSLTTIGERAFSGCSGLTSLILPSSLTTIGGYTFENCSGLTSLTLPASITTIGSGAFEGCTGLMSLTLPASLTKIGDYTFSRCSGLKNLTLPASITTIGNNAFCGCSALTSLTLPLNVTKIGIYAFVGCSGLTSFTLPAGVTEIGDYAFSDCSRLTSLTIPSSVKSLGDYAFENCSSLQSVYVSWPTPISAGSAFSGVDKSKCTLYVPQGTETDYFLADVWGYFGNIVEYDPTGIDKVTTSTDAKELSRYSVNGQRLFAPVKGLNIVKYSDGSVKKVVVQ